MDRTNNHDIKYKVLEWFANGRVGLSSEAMALCVAGIETHKKSHPYDPDDLNRCLLFLEAVPEARQHMDKIAMLSEPWKNLVARWSELEKTFIDEVGLNWSNGNRAKKTYALMQEILVR